MQELNISLLLFRLAPSRLYKIWNFSFKHILHFFEVGLNFVDLSLSLQVTVCAIPLSFSLGRKDFDWKIHPAGSLEDEESCHKSQWFTAMS